MRATEQKLKTLLLGPEDYRLGAPLEILGEPGLIKLAGDDTGNAVSIIQFTAPKFSGPPLHRLDREDEWFYVLDGELTWEIDGQRYTGVAGASVFIPRGTVHTYQNFRDETAHLLIMVTPAGLDQFFQDLTSLNKGLSQPDLAGTGRLMQSYGMELLGPPLSSADESAAAQPAGGAFMQYVRHALVNVSRCFVDGVRHPHPLRRLGRLSQARRKRIPAHSNCAVRPSPTGPRTLSLGPHLAL